MKNSTIKVPFSAPLSEMDSTEKTVGCRANNPDICANNGLPTICAYARADGMCMKPSRAWKKQYDKLKQEQKNDETI